MPRSEPLLLGIDVGTTDLKMVVLGAQSGAVRAWAARRLAVRETADGTREQIPLALVRAVRALARDLRGRVGDRAWQGVGGVGLAAQGGSAILCDRCSGSALTPMQLWSDTRPLDRLAEIARRRPHGYWRRLSRLDAPGAGLARIAWLRERHPRLVPSARANRPATIYAGAGEYAFFQLTGVWRQDAGNALQIGCYSVPRQALVADPLEVVGVPLDFVAPLRMGHSTHPLCANGSRMLGLPVGVPVAGPYIDHEAGYLSAAGVGRHPLQCSLGTAWVGNFVLSGAPPPSAALDLILPSPRGAGALVLRVMGAGNATWNWGLATLLGGRGPDALARADRVFAERLLPPPGLIALPWFTRPNRWAPQRAGNGVLAGLGSHTTPTDLLRALAAGMVFEFALLFESVRTAGLVDGVVLGGGAAQGRGFQRLMAAVFSPLAVYTACDQALSSARGSIHAFSPRAARAAAGGGARRVPAPAAAELARMREQLAMYRAARQAMGAEARP